MFAGDFAAAGRYVAPSSRGAFLVLTDGLGSSSVKARNLAVGRTTVTGSTAVAILTGTVCSTAGKTSKSVQRCVTNTDPAGSSPIFEVDLMRQSGGRWLVVFRAPASASGGGSTGATGSTPAGGATGSP